VLSFRQVGGVARKALMDTQTAAEQRSIDVWLEEAVRSLPPHLRQGKCRITLHIAGSDVKADIELLGIVVKTGGPITN